MIYCMYYLFSQFAVYVHCACNCIHANKFCACIVILYAKYVRCLNAELQQYAAKKNRIYERCKNSNKITIYIYCASAEGTNLIRLYCKEQSQFMSRWNIAVKTTDKPPNHWCSNANNQMHGIQVFSIGTGGCTKWTGFSFSFFRFHRFNCRKKKKIIEKS